MGRLAAGQENDEEVDGKENGNQQHHLPKAGQSVKGVLVTHNFHSKIVAPEDLATYTPLRVGTIASKVHVPFGGSIVTLKVFLTEMFAGITVTEPMEDENKDGGITIFRLGSLVQVIVGKGTAIVEWDANPKGDVLADAILSLIMHAQSSAASVRMTSQPCRHYRPREEENKDTQDSKKIKTRTSTVESRLKFIYTTLKEQFENVEAIYEGSKGVYEIITDCGYLPVDETKKGNDNDGDETTKDDSNNNLLNCTVTVLFQDQDGDQAQVAVESRDEQMANHVRNCIQTLAHAMQPINVRVGATGATKNESSQVDGGNTKSKHPLSKEEAESNTVVVKMEE